jgi:hypothetical protein
MKERVKNIGKDIIAILSVTALIAVIVLPISSRLNSDIVDVNVSINKDFLVDGSENISGLALWSADRNGDGKQSPDEENVEIVEHFPDAWGNVNEGYSLKFFEESPMTKSLDLFCDGSPLAAAFVEVGGEVTEISGREITISFKGNNVRFYINENALVEIVLLGNRFRSRFESIDLGDLVDVLGVLQYGNNDPFVVAQVIVVPK